MDVDFFPSAHRPAAKLAKHAKQASKQHYQLRLTSQCEFFVQSTPRITMVLPGRIGSSRYVFLYAIESCFSSFFSTPSVPPRFNLVQSRTLRKNL